MIFAALTGGDINYIEVYELKSSVTRVGSCLGPMVAPWNS